MASPAGVIVQSGLVGLVRACRGDVQIGLCVMVRGKVKEIFGEGRCVRVIGNNNIVGDDYVYEGMQGHFVMDVIWCHLVGGEEVKNSRNVRTG